MDKDKIPAIFYVSAEWLEHYAVLTGVVTASQVEIIDVNHIVPGFSIYKSYIAELIFRNWPKGDDMTAWWS